MFYTSEQMKRKPMNKPTIKRTARIYFNTCFFSFVNFTKWTCPKLRHLKCFEIVFCIILSFLLLKQEIFVTLCSQSMPRDIANDLETIQNKTLFHKRWVTINYKFHFSYNDLARAMIAIICVMLHLCYSYIL